MKTMFKLCVVALSLIVVPAAFAVDFAADVETNTTLESSAEDLMNFDSGGRVHLKISGRVENEDGMFVASQGDAMVDQGGNTGVDDAWIQVGNPSFNLKVGRMELSGLFDKGEDVYIAGAAGGPDRAEVNEVRGREGMEYALTFTASENVTVELGAQYGSVELPSEADGNVIGFRPVVKFSSGAVSVKFGGEYEMQMADDSNSDEQVTEVGAGGTVEFGAGNMTIGVAGGFEGWSGEDADGMDMDDESTVSGGGYLKMGVGENDMLGLGAFYSMYSNDDTDAETDHMQAYASFVHALPVEGAKVKFGASFAAAGQDADETGFGVRMRFNFDF